MIRFKRTLNIIKELEIDSMHACAQSRFIAMVSSLIARPWASSKILVLFIMLDFPQALYKIIHSKTASPLVSVLCVNLTCTNV